MTRKCKFKRRTECMVAVVDNHPSPADPCRKTPGRPRAATPGSMICDSAPPGERVTLASTRVKPAATKTAAPAAEGTAAENTKKSVSGSIVEFVIVGLLAVAYAMMRRRA
ncbi:MAG: hypothetical protein U9Q68_08270 [Euryarchaeota archaeon]|nr:hypothetical protein [Euryarchaeota archaeon]